MKKKIVAGLFPVIAILFLLAIPADAAKGTWTSAWDYDLNNMSSVGTTNAYTEKGYFQLRVVKAGNSIIGNYTVQLGVHQSGSKNFTGGGLTDKQGQVLCSPQYYHTPWFNS